MDDQTPPTIPTPRALVIMGVSGSGKSTVGRLLADALGWAFADADDFHPPANRAKMAAGQPLDDHDRAPWLDALAGLLRDHLDQDAPLVLACSALKHAYRDRLAVSPRVAFVHLQGDPALIAARLAARSDHFMPAALLTSQLAALEPPAHAITADIAPPPAEIVANLRRRLRL
ncbi:MAG: gluconokinase [Verrucomicrobiota bacterium]